VTARFFPGVWAVGLGLLFFGPGPSGRIHPKIQRANSSSIQTTGTEPLLLIGEIAELTGLTKKTLRFYEEQGVLMPARRAANGYREYDWDSVARLDFIARAKAAGLSIAQIRHILATCEPGHATCFGVRVVLENQLAELDQKILELSARREAVAASLAAVASGDPSACDSSKVCSYL
jgi:MerR family transcriptional regulator, copper efflux regulator